MKKSLLLNLMLLIMSWSIHAQTATPPSSGDGSASNPYQIATLENLYWISVNKVVWDKHFIQTANIDASATASWSDGGWKPIGTLELDYTLYPFSGSYDGKNHSISGLTINLPNSGFYYNGLFGYAQGATIQNLGLLDLSIVTLYEAGGLCGRLKDCIVMNCHTTGYVTTTIMDYGYSTGGLAAGTYNSTLSDCYSTCNVSGTGNVGGMFGACELSTIFDCHSSGNVGHSATTTGSKIGGFAGKISGSSLSKIFSTGNVIATGDWTTGNSTGGFVGHSSSYYFEPYQSTLISDCYSSGNVSGGSKIGGFVGTNYCASGTSTITKCYSRGVITGTGSVWGFVGENSGTINKCYFDAEVDGLSHTLSGTTYYGATGKTTAEMKIQSTYTDWDFISIWGIGGGNNDGYPYLLPASTCTDGTITLTSGSENQTVCYGTAISPIVFTIGGGATRAEVTGLPDGLTGNLSGETFTIIGSSTVSGSFPYTVTTSGAASPCTNATATGTITVFGYSGGNGTEDNPFQIATLADLQFLSENDCHWDKHFIQTSDIDASATSGWGAGGWSPIGTSSAPFIGTYDGMGHTIGNLYINQPESVYSGLFGYTGSMSSPIPAKIQNLGVINVNINGGYFLGALVGHNQRGYISNCYSTGTVIGNNSFVGGLVGSSVFSSYITYCYSEANVTGATGDLYVGGLVGYILDSEISNSYSRGSVTSTFDHYRNTYCGGLVGVANGNALIRNCYSTGLVSGYVEPSLTAHVYGGLIARSDGTVSVVNSFWDIETSGATTSAGGTGKTTTLMKFQFTYTGWDFTTIWGINAGKNDGYPYLVTSSACVDGTLTLLTGFNTQNVYTNTNITPIVFYVGGGTFGASISPALPTGLSGVYDEATRKYTISGICSSPVVYNYSVTTADTKLPCKEATITGTITIIPQPECAGFAVGLHGSYDDPDSYPEAFTQYPELAVGSPDGRPANLNFPGEYLALDITGSPNLYRPAGSSVKLFYNVPLSFYPCNPELNVQCSMNGTEWSAPSSYTFQMEGYNKEIEIPLTENTRYIKLTLTNCFVSSGILIDAVTYDQDLIPCMCVTNPDAPTVASNGPVCEGGTLSLTASTVSGATYSWTGPDNYSSNEQNPTVSAAATTGMAGIYSVTVTVGECTSEPATTIVVVNPLPEASIIRNNSPICHDSYAGFYLEGTPGAEVTYSFDGGATKSSVTLEGGKAEVNFLGATSDVTLLLFSVKNLTTGCVRTLNGTSTVTIAPIPTASISGVHNACTSTTLTAITNASSPAYEWHKDGELLTGENSSTLIVTQSGSYRLMVTDGITRCPGISEAFFVTINPLPEISITGNNGPICADQDAVFYLNGTPGAEVTYSFDGGTTTRNISLSLIGGTATITRMEALSDVTLSLVSIINTSTGCSKSINSASAVIVYPDPEVSISGHHEDCISTTLTAVTDASEPDYTWFIVEEEEPVKVGDGLSLEVTQSDEYWLSVTDESTGCVGFSGPFAVSINPLPEITEVKNNSPICADQDAVFNLSGTPGAEVTYSFDGGTTTRNISLSLIGGTATITRMEALSDVTLSLVSIKMNTPGCTQALTSTSTVTVNPDPNVSINGSHEDCASTTLTAVTDASKPVYAWFIIEDEEPIQVGDDSTLEVTQSDDYYLFVTDEITGCFGFSGPYAVSINPLPAVAITGNTSIIIGGTTTLNPTTGGTWKSNNQDVATVTNTGLVTGVASGTATFTFCDANTGCIATTEQITVTGTPPVFTACPGNQTANSEAGLCSAVVTYEAVVAGTPEPVITYQFSGATAGSGSGTGSGAAFNTGVTNVTITASNGILPDVTCTFTITVTDNEAPEITCAQEITQTADAGMCSADVTVVPPMVTDNCDNNVFLVNNIELIKNGNFNAGTSYWRDCSNAAEVNTEEYYIVPEPPHSSNYVAEIDGVVRLCQEISGFTVGNKYVLTFKASRRQNDKTPNPVSATVAIDGGALSQLVTRANTVFDLTAESYEFTATQTMHKLTFTPYSDNKGTLGLIVDDISVRGMTYPVGKTTLVWTATDDYGNTATCEQVITVTDNEAPVITGVAEVTQSADAGSCSAVVTETAPEATDNCGILGSVVGTRSDAPLTLADPYPVGTTTITWTVSDIHGNSATPVTQLVTVTDNEAPEITCGSGITQTADPGMCFAVINVVPPTVADNCDNNVLAVSNTELIKNGNFNAGTSNWRDCSNAAEVNTEEYYIVPIPPHSSNFVAEIDGVVRLCQTISGFTVGEKYVLTFKASRRQNDNTPNPVSANVVVDGGVLSEVVSRTNTIFDLTPESFEFTATQTTHKLTFTPYTDNKGTLGLIVDDVSVRSMTYPVGTTTLVWTATDVYGNTATCKQKITVTDNEAPVITDEDDITQTADAGLCSAVVEVTAPEATDNCGVLGSVAGTRSDAPLTLADPFPVGKTTITWTVSDIHGNPAAPVTQSVTVTDNEAPKIACAQGIDQPADPGMCSATIAVIPPAVTDNCDNHVLAVSNTELIKNGSFNAGILNWQECGNKAEVNTEEYYIVPVPSKSSNFVAEIDNEVSLCQNITGFTPGHKYVLTFKASRRQNSSTPNPVGANVVIDGGALSKVVTRANTIFNLTPESFEFTATQTTHQLTFKPSANNTKTLGIIVDDVSIRSITYPVGTSTLVWTATDVYGNTATCKQKITVNDDELPAITCPETDASYSTDAGKCTRLLTFDATATDNCGIDATSYRYFIGTDEITFPYLFPLGTTTVNSKVSDIHGNTGECNFKVVVNKITTNTAVTVVPNHQKYSDMATFTATVEPGQCGDNSMAETKVLFKVGSQELPPAVPVALVDGEWKATAERALLENPSSPSNGQMAPGDHTVTAVFQNEPEIFIVNDPTTTLTITCEDDISVTTDNSETYFTANPTSGKGDVWFRAYVEETDGSPGNIAKANIDFLNELSSPPSIINSDPALVTPIAGEQKAVSVYTLSDYQLNNSEMTTTGGHSWLVRAQTGTGSYYCGEDEGEPVVFILAMPGGDFVTGGGKYIHTQSAGAYAATAGTWMNFGFNMKWNKSGKNLQGSINVVFRNGSKIYHIKSNAINALAVSQTNQGGLTYNTGIMTTKANLTDITDPLNPVNTPYGGNLNLKVVVWDATSINGGTADKITVELTASDNTTLVYSSFASGITLSDVIKGGNINVRNTNGIYVPPTCGAPTHVFASNLTQTSAQITWDAVTYTSTCEVKYKLSSSSAWSSGGTTSGNTQALSGLSSGTNYNVQVFRTCDGSTTPLESTILAFTTATDNSSICTVTGLIALTDNTNKVTLSWSPVNTEVTSPPVSYKVEYKKSTATIWTAVNCAVPNLVLTLATSTKYNWRITPSCGSSSINGPDFTTGSTKTKAAGIATGILPDIEYAELKVYPNPFSDRLNFEFVSPSDDRVRIDIFDLSGRLLETVFDNTVKAGVNYNAALEADKLVSGIYLYRMTMGSQVYNGKVILNKK